MHRRDDGWHAWLCCHPLADPGGEDRMWTRYLTSHNGLSWTEHGEVLGPGSGGWDDRGARVTAIASWEPLVVLYDGRYERLPEVRVTSPHSDGACRYATVVDAADGMRVYAEVARPNGAHDLVVTRRPAGAAGTPAAGQQPAQNQTAQNQR